MAVAISELSRSRDGKGIPAREFEVEEFVLGRLINKTPGLLFAINKKQGLVEDRGSFYALPPERMQEIGLNLLRRFGLDEASGRKVEDETGEGDDVTVFDAGDRSFEKRVCKDKNTDEKFRVRWYQEFPGGKIR